MNFIGIGNFRKEIMEKGLFIQLSQLGVDPLESEEGEHSKQKL